MPITKFVSSFKRAIFGQKQEAEFDVYEDVLVDSFQFVPASRALKRRSRSLADVNCISKVFFLLKSMFQETVINGN
jgi:hypothetical protein